MEQTCLSLYKLMNKQFPNIQEFSKASGMPMRRITAFCQGKRTPNLAEIDHLAEVLRVTPMELVHIFLASKSPNG